MKKFEFKYLLNYWFIGALALLLFNDFFLKETFHNALTGKISDFAGLLFLPLFLLAFFPTRIKEILFGTAIFFVYWKSPLSTSLINIVNSLSGFHFERVIDYSDLMALSILPFVFYLFKTIDNRIQLRIHPVFPILVGSFALFSTSQEFEMIYLQEEFLIEKEYSQLIQQIEADSLLLNANEVHISIAHYTNSDTGNFSLSIYGGQLNNEAQVYGIIYRQDSLNSIVYLDYYEQAQDCGLLGRRCKFKNDSKEIVLQTLEDQFISLL